MWKDAKYLLAYLLPLAAFVGVYYGGWLSFSAFILAFVCIPVIESILPANPANHADSSEMSREKRKFFDILLYLNVPIVYGLVVFLGYRVSFSSLDTYELIGMTLGVGIIVGTCGINVGHELGHRENAFEQLLARLLLTPAFYTHFTMEHNYGHHKNVGTPSDANTARYGESVYAFWIRSVSTAYVNAWTLQRSFLEKKGVAYWNLRENIVLQGMILQILYLVLVFTFLSLPGALAVIIAGIIGVLLLESVNYIEHYGLVRKQMPSGRYEPVNPSHSWNSDHELGRIFLYELTRHSDHHFKSTRKYQILRHLEDSPQLPYGYPASLIIALVPPIWMSMVNPRVKATMAS